MSSSSPSLRFANCDHYRTALASDLGTCAPCDEVTLWASISGTAYVRPVLIPVCTPTGLLTGRYGLDLVACARVVVLRCRPTLRWRLPPALTTQLSHADEVASWGCSGSAVIVYSRTWRQDIAFPSLLRGSDDKCELSGGERQRGGDSASCSVPQPVRRVVHRSAWCTMYRSFPSYHLAARGPLCCSCFLRSALSAQSIIQQEI